MNGDIEKKPFGDDIISDNTDNNNKGDIENETEKIDKDHTQGEKEDGQVFCSEGKDTFEEGKDPFEEGQEAYQGGQGACEKEEAPRKEAEACKEKVQSADEISREAQAYTPPTTYSASYYAPPERSSSKSEKSNKRFSAGFVVALTSVCIVLSLVFGALSGMMASAFLNRDTTDDVGVPRGNGDDTQATSGAENVITINKSDSPTKVEQVIESGEEDVMSVVEVVDSVAASVVEVTTLKTSNYGQYVSGGAGSGVIIAQGGGYAYIVTNYHVVGGSDYIAVRLTDKSEYEAKYIDGDEYDDIAIIRIAETKELCVAKIGSSDSLRVGEGVVAIGNPLGELGGTVTDGIVSALDREITIGGVTMTLLQTNAAVNPGNSGGGLFNMAGRLVGIVNAKHQESGIEGLGFAIPIDRVYSDLIEIIEDGYIHGRVTIGIEAIYLDKMNALYYFRSGREGVYVISSENEDFKVGDRIITIDSKEISSESDYVGVVKELEIGKEIVIEVARGNSTQKVTTVVEEYIPENIEVK